MKEDWEECNLEDFIKLIDYRYPSDKPHLESRLLND